MILLSALGLVYENKTKRCNYCFLFQILKETVDEFVMEADAIPVGLDTLQGHLDEIQTHFDSLLLEHKQFEESCHEWDEYFALASKELSSCRAFKACTLQDMSNNLDRIQVILFIYLFIIHTVVVVVDLIFGILFGLWLIWLRSLSQVQPC